MGYDFYAEVMGYKINRNYLNPGDVLFVTLRMRNRGASWAVEDYHFVVDICFGHQRKIENKQYNYRVTSYAFPGTLQWAPGMETEVTLRWEANVGWSGTYILSCSILDKNNFPIHFYIQGLGEVLSFNAGEINISWNLGRPWIAENTRAVEKQFTENDIENDNGNDNDNDHEMILFTNKEISFNCNYSELSSAITLSDEISVILSRNQPQIYSINGVCPYFAAPVVAIKRLSTNDIVALETMCHEMTTSNYKLCFTICMYSKKYVRYIGTILCEGSVVVSFSLSLTINGSALKLEVTDRNEIADYELLSIKYPSLIEMDNGYLLDFYGGGRLVEIKEATPIFFEKVYDVRNAAVLFDEKLMFIVESAHIDSTLTTGVFSVYKHKRGFIGGGIICKIPADGNRPGIPVINPPVFTIESLNALHNDFKWTDAATFLRRDIAPNHARSLYCDAFFYKQLSTWGPLPAENYRKNDSHPSTQNLFRAVTFKEIAENVRKFANLTDHSKQIIYIGGFQSHGFDDDYPYPYDTDIRSGSIYDLSEALINMREYNAVSGLHDNFDDVSHRHLQDFPYVAIDKRGDYWHGWVWAAGATYMTAWKRYVDSGAMAERINKMCDMLPLVDSYHIDVLTAETCRYDFDLEAPASAEDSFHAKMATVAEWNKHGIDISSELLTHPSIGHIGFALHTRMDTKEAYIPSDIFVPLVHMIYHGIIGYTAPSYTVEQILWGLLIGAQTFYEENITGELCVSRYYIQNIPAMKLYDKIMIDFVFNDQCACAYYSNESSVSVDFMKETYNVVVEGVLIGHNFSTFIPAHTLGAYLAYSFNDDIHIYANPTVFSNAKRLNAIRLTEEGEKDIIDNAAVIDNDYVILKLPPMTPIIIYPEYAGNRMS